MQLLVYINVVYEQEDRYTYTQAFISEMLSVLYTYTDKETHVIKLWASSQHCYEHVIYIKHSVAVAN